MPFIWSVREPAGNWSHYLHSPSGIVHVVHGKNGDGDLDVDDYEVKPITRAGFNKVQLTAAYIHRLGWRDTGGGVLDHDGTYVYERP
jgi:hypothetical protein